jgi:nucleoside-diphosphate-sugar epimerase
MGEPLARWFHDVYGLEVVVVRIGWFLDYCSPELHNHPDAADVWLSPADAVRLFRRAIDAPDVGGYLVVHGTSLTARERLARTGWDVLGYEPRDEYAAFRASPPTSSRPR